MEIAFQADYRNDLILISYASTAGTTNDLMLDLNGDGTANLLINNNLATLSGFDYDTLMDGELHRLGVSWDSTNGDWRVYADGQLIDLGTGLATGQTISGGVGSTLLIGQEQDTVGGGFNSSQIFSGTLYDVRIWNEVRSEAEIALNYQHKFDSGSLPSGLIANWQMDRLQRIE